MTGKLLALLLATAALMVIGSQAVTAEPQLTGFEFTIEGPFGDGGIDFEDATWAEVKEDLEAVHAEALNAQVTPSTTLRLAPDGMVELDVTNGEVWFSNPPDGEDTPDQAPNYAMTFRGDTDYLGAVEVLGTARWEDGDDQDPVLHVVLRWDNVDLVTFEPNFLDVDVELTRAWMALTPNANDPELRPYRFPNDADFFDDGLPGTDDTMPVKSTFMPIDVVNPPDELPSEGVTFRGVMDDTGYVAEAVRGLGLSGQARLDGEISYGPLMSKCEADPTTGYNKCANGLVGQQGKVQGYGVRLEATLPLLGQDEIDDLEVEYETSLPERVKLDAGWKLAIEYQTGLGQFTAEVEGNALVDLQEPQPVTMGGHVSFSRSSTFGTTNVEVGFQAGNFSLFDVEWLLVKRAEVNLVFTVVKETTSTGHTTGKAHRPKSGAAGALVGEVTVDWEPITGVVDDELTAQLRIAAGTTKLGNDQILGGSITLSAASTGSTTSLAKIATGTGITVPDDAIGFSVDNLGFSIGYQVTVGDSRNSSIIQQAILLTFTGQTQLELPEVKRPGVTPTGEKSTLETDILVSLHIPLANDSNAGADPAKVLVVVKASGESSENLWLSQLTGLEMAEETDVALPTAYLAIATDDWDVLPEAQDPAVAQFVETREGMFKDRLLYRTGVTVRADIALGGTLAKSFADLGVRFDGDLRLEGTIPLFGGESFGVTIELPEIQFQNDPGETGAEVDGPIHSGTLALSFGQVHSQEDSSRLIIEVRVTGKLNVTVLKEHLPDCKANQPRYSESPDCYDMLKFDVGAAVEVNPTNGAVSVIFEGGLQTDETGWEQPFGMQGLVIHGLRLELTITVSPTSPTPSLQIGLTGSVEVGQPGDLRDVTVSLLLTWKIGTPVVAPIGFTLATDGFGVLDLIDIYNWAADPGAQISKANLNVPDVRLEDVYVAFGTIDNPKLCIRSGFFLAAELHIGGTNQGQVPACNQAGNLPPDDLPPVDENCGNSPTCVAAVLVDVQAGVTISSALSSRVIAEGYLAQTDLGPLKLDPFLVSLRLSASEQRLKMEGGATLLNPLCWQTPSSCSPLTLAEGDFLMDLTPTRLEVYGRVAFVDNGLTAKVHAIGDLNLKAPKLDTFDVQFTAPALVQLGQDLEQGMQQLGQHVAQLGPILQTASSSSGQDLLDAVNQLGAELKRVGDQAANDVAADLIEVVADAQDFVNDVNAFLATIGWDPIKLDAVVDIALNGWTIDLDEIKLAGVRDTKGNCVLFEVDGKCWVIPPRIEFPGLCDAPDNQSHALCAKGQTTQHAVQAAVGDTFANRVDTDLGPPGALTAAAFSTAASGGGLDVHDLGKDPDEVLGILDDAFDSTDSQITCGGTSVDFAGGQINEIVLGITANGAQTTIDAPVDLQSAAPDEGILQESVQTLVDGTGSSGQCPSVTIEEAVPPAITMKVTRVFGAAVSSIQEGQWVRASGTAGTTDREGAFTPLDSLTVHWGDDTTEVVTPASDGSWTAGPHTYEDDGGFLLAATSGLHEAYARLSVTNVAPTATITAPSAPIDEGDEFSLTIDITDPGIRDTHTVVVLWGDGTRSSAGAGDTADGSVTLTHTYVDEGASGADAGATDPLTALANLVVQVTDDDGGKATQRPTLTVSNVAPLASLAVLGSVEDGVLDATVPRDESSRPILDEATTWRFELTVEDAGTRDLLRATITWPDGSPDEDVWLRATGAVQRTAVVDHVWTDDDVTGTPRDLHDIEVTVHDGDLGEDDVTLAAWIDDVAPSVTTFAVTPTTHVENRSDVVVNLVFDDPSLEDSHVVTIDWGDGWTGGEVQHGTVDPGDDPDIDVRSSTERYTTFTVPAPGLDGTTTRSVSLVNRYGDNGDYTITVDVLDDDTLGDDDDLDLEVTNEDPVHGIDRATAIAAGEAFVTVGPTTTWFGTEGSPVVFEDDANDVGSDDLSFSWWTADQTGSRNVPLRILDLWRASTGAEAGPVDLPSSPLVDPSQTLTGVGVLDRTQAHVTNTLTHTWNEACLYGVTAAVVDDDDGAPPVDQVPVVIQRQRTAGDDKHRNFGQWKDAIDSGEVSQSTLDCYLDIAGHLSSVLLGASELDDDTVPTDPTPWVTRFGTVDVTARDGPLPVIFTDTPGKGRGKLETEQAKLDRSLLSALMNLADGAFQWDTQLEAGIPFWKTIEEIEAVRRNSTDPKAVAGARQRLWIMGIG